MIHNSKFPLIGGHVSVAGGIEKGPINDKKIGAEVIQIFASSPRSFKPSSYTEEQYRLFCQYAQEAGIKKTFLHGVYLINLADIDADYRKASIQSLLMYLKTAEAIEGTGVIFHPGYRNTDDHDVALRNVILSCQQILDQAPPNQYLIIENSAGARGSMCSNLEELKAIFSEISDQRLRVCLDTQHTFAAGFDYRTPQALDEFIKTIDKAIGWDKIVAVHCNDSKTEFGSHVDRHENIGKGKIGIEPIKLLANHASFKDIPFILEVPGLEDKGPDKPNVDLLRSLVNTA